MISPVRHIAAMTPYALAHLAAPEGKALISLSQNESLRGPSPLAVAAGRDALSASHLYPDPDWSALRSVLSDIYGVPTDTILCGSGSMELIASLAQVYADEHHSVLAPAHAYPFFRTAAQLARARYDTAPERKGALCVDALLEALRPDTRIVFVANPGNPTGTRVSREALLRLRLELPQHVLLVIDEAYGEFSDHLNEPVFDLVERGDTVVLRTLSKAYGLAGLRVGWGSFPPQIVQEMRKALNPNNISVAAQAAAEGAVRDQRYMRETCAMTMQLRDEFIARLRNCGFSVPDSYTNFVVIRFDDAATAARADAFLRCEGIVARGQSGAGLPASLRITVGAEDHMATTATLMQKWAQGGMQ